MCAYCVNRVGGQDRGTPVTCRHYLPCRVPTTKFWKHAGSERFPLEYILQETQEVETTSQLLGTTRMRVIRSKRQTTVISRVSCATPIVPRRFSCPTTVGLLRSSRASKEFEITDQFLINRVASSLLPRWRKADQIRHSIRCLSAREIVAWTPFPCS